MTTYTGQTGYIEADSNQVGEIKSFSVEMSAATLDDTVQGDTWNTKKAGLKSWSGSMEGFADLEDTGQASVAVGAELDCVFYTSSTTGAGSVKITGTVVVTSVSYGSELESCVTFSASFEGNGSATVEANDPV